MSGKSEHGGGEKAMREELVEIEQSETVRVDRLLSRWRRVMSNLQELTDGQE